MLLSFRPRRLASCSTDRDPENPWLRTSMSNPTFTCLCVTHKSDSMMGDVEISWNSASVL